MKYIPIKTNFIYPELKNETFRFGSSILDRTVLRPDGDWRDYLPPFEDQRKNGVESSACYIDAQQHAIATILEEKYNIKNQNFSSRFTSIFSNGNEMGGDPIRAAQSIRHDGLVKEDSLPFTDNITSWDEFNSWQGGNKEQCIKEGQEFLKKFKPQYDIVYEITDTIESKYDKLRQSLKLSPSPISVVGWIENNDVYVKPPNTRDNHLTLCVYLDDNNCPYVMDTYEPYIKKLEPFYNSEFSMRWTVDRIYSPHWWENLLNYFRKLKIT